MYMTPQEGASLPPAGVEVVFALKGEIARRCRSDARVDPIERFAFYEEARGCFALIRTMERRPYRNVILAKGFCRPRLHHVLRQSAAIAAS